jgi:putative SOS response-associated peptidase YedK
VMNIRNTSSPHWRAWLKPENRCLVPFNGFAEYAPEPNPETTATRELLAQHAGPISTEVGTADDNSARDR